MYFDPYGASTSADVPSMANTSRFGYAGGKYHGNGLYHYGARFYDTASMRWTQPDPLLNASDVRQANRFAYVGGDPVNATDPTGTVAFIIPAAVAAARIGGGIAIRSGAGRAATGGASRAVRSTDPQKISTGQTIGSIRHGSIRSKTS